MCEQPDGEENNQFSSPSRSRLRSSPLWAGQVDRLMRLANDDMSREKTDPKNEMMTITDVMA